MMSTKRCGVLSAARSARSAALSVLRSVALPVLLLFAVLCFSPVAKAEDSIDYDTLKKDLMAILKVAQSEDFQSLMSYKEMQELVLALLEEGGAFVVNEPELAAEICVTLGVDESIMWILPDMIKLYGCTEDEVRALLESDENRELLEAAVRLLQDPEIAELAEQFAEMFPDIERS